MRRLVCVWFVWTWLGLLSAWSQTYDERLAALGYDALTTLDLSDAGHLDLAQPRLAYVNLQSHRGLPVGRRDTVQAWLEYFDPASQTYLRKRVVLREQGQNSLAFPKRNVSIDLCEDEWLGEETPVVVFDGWVRQDGFHLKAFYTDWLRGVSMVSYQLYDEIERTLPEGQQRIWQRAGVEGHAKSRCYPDGFPCALYLNGDFYGIYSWALRKHRRNMSMEKHNLLHIHLDGYLGEEFWGGQIDWTAFEVRNPKDLFTADGLLYDGDAPRQLAEGPVRMAIEALSQRCAELRLMESQGASFDEMRDAIAGYFDVTSLVNYVVFSLVVSNYDGFLKNWQWVTYDGVRWAVAPYDLDCTFGNFHGGTFVFPPRLSYINSTYTMGKTRYGIVALLWEYFFEEMVDRYCALRSAGIVDEQHIIDLLYAWYDRIGPELYEAEWARWPECYCISETITAEGWQATEEWPQYYGLPKWASWHRYIPGECCALDSRVWRATASSQGVRPYIQLGYTDSLERLTDWVCERISYEDGLFGYWPVSRPSVKADGEATPQTPCRSQRYGLDGKPATGEGGRLRIEGGSVRWVAGQSMPSRRSNCSR